MLVALSPWEGSGRKEVRKGGRKKGKEAGGEGKKSGMEGRREEDRDTGRNTEEKTERREGRQEDRKGERGKKRMNAVGPGTLKEPSRTPPGKRGAQNHHFRTLLSDPNSTVVTADPIRERREPLRRTFSLPLIVPQHVPNNSQGFDL